MQKIENLIINKDVTVREALRKIDESAKRIVFVVDDDKRLLGCITDGDVRRWILKNKSMSAKSEEVMHKNAVTINSSEILDAKRIMIEKSITAIPVVSKDKTIEDVIFLYQDEADKTSSDELRETPVVIMAGGLGTRLYPYTKILPKPLIPIGDTPILERIIDKFNKFGAKKFYLTVNYKKNMIKSYFNDLDKNYEVDYVEENKPLGTGGSLSLLKGKIDKPFFVSNCDILIEEDYDKILNFHKKSGNKITVITSIKNFVIPYGVFRLNEEGCINEIEEKPEYSYLINTGMYVLEPEVLNDIPDDQFFNLPDIIEKYMHDNIKVGIYPISEQSWMDMGQLNEMKNMVERIEQKENNNK